MPIKTLGSLGKIRVGRVTGNTHIFFFGLILKNSIVINFGALYSSIIIAYPLKIPLSSDKFYTFKTSSIEGRGHLISETIDVSRISVVFIRFKLTK